MNMSGPREEKLGNASRFLCNKDTGGVGQCGISGAQKGVLIKVNIFATFLRRIISQFLVIRRSRICLNISQNNMIKLKATCSIWSVVCPRS